jgi:hypothetical protein
MMKGIFKIHPCTFTIVAFLFLAISSNAQRRFCASEEVLKKQLAEDPQFRQIRDEIERHTSAFKNRASDRGGMLEITIPVVVHVVHFNETQNVSDNQIMAQIEVLNMDFRRTNADAINTPSEFQSVAADCEINFCLAKQDPLGNPTNGIERRLTTVDGFASSGNDNVKFFASGGLDGWDRDRYLNIWVCNVFASDYEAYAQFPGGSAARDGIICDFAFFGTENTTYKGRVITHEVGHWLNCYHIWGDDNTCDDGDRGDAVDDTPNQAWDSEGCPTFPQKSCGNGPNGDMFMNYMDYTDGSCMNLFTQGQKTRMQALFASGGARASLALSYCVNACSSPYAITEIFANTVYSVDMNMPGDIIIHSGAELRVEATIGMRPGARILVERNARLHVKSSGILTAECQNWAGIQVLGNRQKIQPEHNAPLTDPDQAGIVWIEGGTVEWARNGVTAGGGYGPEFWGGLIRASNDAIFKNNRKDVEFLSYKLPHPNKNKSKFLNTTFIEIGEAFANTEGVTIWETDGIEFNNCIFKNKDSEGIYTYDAGVSILNNNRFEDNLAGTVSRSTYPMAVENKVQIGLGSALENKFTNNQFHVLASHVAGIGGFSLEVINNNFTGGQYGVLVDGGSNFRIAGNLLTSTSSSGVRVSNTGFNNVMNQNLIGCNTFKECDTQGISANGDNKEMQFLRNDFQMSSGIDFFLGHWSTPQMKGSVRETQGEDDRAAANCFTDPGLRADIIAPINQTSPFKYYYLASEPPAGCDPEPLSLGNYAKESVANSLPVIDCDQFGGLPPGLTDPNSGDLNTRRARLQQLAPYIATDENALNQYYKTLQQKDAILRYLLEQSHASGQYATMEGLLAGEQSKAADWAIFGLRMARKDYANAALWLNQLPIQSYEDAQFRDVQIINIQRLQNLGTFQLSVGQETYLNSVAESTSPVRGYAQAILGLLKDRRFYPEDLNSGSEYSMPGLQGEAGKPAQNTAEFRVYPVPASSAITISWPSLPAESDANLLVYDIYGRQQINEPIAPHESERRLETGWLPVGVYFLVISDRGKSVHQTKISIQR